MSVRTQMRFFPILAIGIVVFLAVEMSFSMFRKPVIIESTDLASHEVYLAETISLDCHTDSKTVFKTQSSSVRLVGCVEDGKELLKIVNVSTGVFATIFDNESSYSTDYLSLIRGRNVVRVTFNDEGGTKTSKDYDIHVN